MFVKMTSLLDQATKQIVSKRASANGPLLEFRNAASFDVEEMIKFVDAEDILEFRVRIQMVCL